MAEKLCELGVGELGRLYRLREALPTEVVAAHLERCERLNPDLNAFLTLMHESAMEAAWAAERNFRAGVDLGPLQGIPISVKDLIRVSGTRTTAASRILLTAPVDRSDSEVARRLRMAGAIIVGKTNLHEFASGEPDPIGPFGWVQNPRRIGHHPGMSSSGAGAAIAAGLGVVAVGTDTGGSVRVPACFCGTVGFKPTTGRINMDGVIPLSHTLDSIGFLGRRVSDVAPAWRCLAGYFPSHNEDDGRSLEEQYVGAHQALYGWHIGVFRGGVFDRLQPAVARAFESTLVHLKRLGCVLTDFAAPDVEALSELTLAITRSEAAAFHEQYRGKEHLYGSDFLKQRIIPGREAKALDYLSALRQQANHRRTWTEKTRQFRLMLLPSSPIVAPAHGSDSVDLCGESVYYRRAAGRFARPLNCLQWPALTIPNGVDDLGLPTGVQIVGRPDTESDILFLGSLLEDSLSLWQKLSIDPYHPSAQ